MVSGAPGAFKWHMDYLLEMNMWTIAFGVMIGLFIFKLIDELSDGIVEILFENKNNEI